MACGHLEYIKPWQEKDSLDKSIMFKFSSFPYHSFVPIKRNSLQKWPKKRYNYRAFIWGKVPHYFWNKELYCIVTRDHRITCSCQHEPVDRLCQVCDCFVPKFTSRSEYRSTWVMLSLLSHSIRQPTTTWRVSMSYVFLLLRHFPTFWAKGKIVLLWPEG